MRSVLFVLLSALLPAAAHADEFYTLVGYRCDAKANELIITYRGAYNAAGEAMVAHKGATEWSSYELLTAADRAQGRDGRVITASCSLHEVRYTIRIGAEAQNSNPGGECGAEVGGWVEVKPGRGAPAFRRSLEPYCHSSDTVTTRIVFHPGSRQPALTEVEQSEFFK